MKYSLIILLALLSTPLWSQVSTPLNGDMDHNNRIDAEDVKVLAKMIVGKQAQEQWQVQNGSIVASTSVVGVTNLCGDINHDKKLSVLDIVRLVAIVKDPAKAERVIIRNGAINYASGSGFGFNPEDGGLVDDGEEEF